ncbi:MAG: flagellar hook-basal body complex protein [Castellaniella sp.]|uniref:flagellar hook-basal body complex protein n=1 Tax=Castellaniella sp. TaxID=1955812 RepID=UPI003C74AD3C
MGFGQGLSGLNAASQNLDVIGNNIANSGTVGFKAGSATFADVYASSRVGLGVQVASINQRFTTGIVSTSGNQFDMAIDGAKGMFVVTQPNGAMLYTRNGQFLADKDHRIVNAQGQQLMGYAPGGTNLIGMTVPVGNIAPQATSTLANKVNLDANADVVPGTTVPEVVGQVTLGGTAYYYKVSGGAYAWYTDATGATAGSPPPAGTYPTGGVAATNITFTAGVPSAGFPTTGGNIPGTATTVGTVYLDDGATTTPHYYTYDGAAYTWYTDASGTTPGGVPADGAYDTGAVAATNVVIDASNQPGSAFPTTGGNVAYVAPVTAVAFDPTNSSSFSKMVPLTVYDSLGNEHRVEQYYTKREPVGGNSIWEVNYVVDGVPPVPPANTALLSFDSAGRLVGGSPTSITFTPGGGTSPADPVNIVVSYDGSTQFGGSYSQDFVQNGYATGEYASMSIGSNGELIANYTNGAKQVMGTLALADFSNLQGLQPVGGNAWAETANSGQPIFGTPGSNGLAVIKGQAVEESNVDMSQELVNMIIAQRTYQANAQTIKTQDQILQTLITMR